MRPNNDEAYIDELEYKIEQMRTAFGLDWVAPACLRLTGAKERLLGALYKNHFVTHDGVRVASLTPDSHGIDDRSSNVASAQLSKLRGRVARFGIVIDSVHSRGYRMTNESRKIIAQMLRQELDPDLSDIFRTLKPPPFDVELGDNFTALRGLS